MGALSNLTSNILGAQTDPSMSGSLTNLAGLNTRIKRQPFLQSQDGNRAVGIAADFLAGLAGRPGTYADTLERRQRLQDQHVTQALQLQKLMQGDPHYFEANNGDQFRVGADGQPQLVYKDPTPKTTYLTADNGDGTKQLIPVVNGVPQLGGMPTLPASAAPADAGMADLPAGFTVRKGGAANTGATFPRSVPGAR